MKKIFKCFYIYLLLIIVITGFYGCNSNKNDFRNNISESDEDEIYKDFICFFWDIYTLEAEEYKPLYSYNDNPYKISKETAIENAEVLKTGSGFFENNETHISNCDGSKESIIENTVVVSDYNREYYIKDIITYSKDGKVEKKQLSDSYKVVSLRDVYNSCMIQVSFKISKYQKLKIVTTFIRPQE